MKAAVVHFIVADLRPDAPAAALQSAIASARDLHDAPGAEAVVVARSDTQLLVVTWLSGREALDAFAESRPHMSFVMQGLAPIIRGMWSAAVEAESTPPASPTALWAFALPASEGVYEWQVRDMLASVTTLPGSAAAGPTVEERERYRAGGVVCLDAMTEPLFVAAVTAVKEEWTSLVGEIAEAYAAVLPA